MIRTQFSYTEADFTEFLWHYSSRGRGKRMWYWMGAALLLTSIVFFATNNLNKGAYMGIVASVVAFPFLWRILFRQNAKKVFQMNAMMREHRNCSIDGSSLHIEGETFESNYNWTEEPMTFAETTNLYLLYTSPTSAVMLPKKAFNDGQRAELLSILERLPKM